ncbi:MAG: inositol monophosphatase family protein [Dehalococcoidia bacterium]
MTSTPDLLAFALELADLADGITMRHYRGGGDVWRKSDGTLVTLADTSTESAIRARILECFPDHAVEGEEEGLTLPPMPMDEPTDGSAEAAPPPDRVKWIVDPIDGTHNFARGAPVWATLIACEVNGRLEVGVASAPALGTRWWAARGEGAHRRDALTGVTERIHVSTRARLEDAQVLYGSYTLTMAAWGGRADRLLRASWRQRGFGDFWGHCLVAEGAAEVMLEGEIAPYDIAAVMVIVEEAGGRMTDIEGVARIDAGHCITSNGVVHDEVLGVLEG